LENNNIDADTLKQNIDTILKTVSDEADMPSEEFKAELDSANQPGNADMNNGVGRQNEIDSSLGRQGAVNQSGTDRQNAVNDLKQQVTANQADSNLDSVKQADNGADKQNVVKDLKQPNTVNQMENEASKQNSVNQPANNEQKNVTGTANNGMGQEQVSLKQNGEKIEQSTLNQPSFTESISKSISEKLSLDKNNVENLIGKLQDAGVSADKLELLSEKSDTPMQLVNNINELVKSLSQTSERKAADIIKSKDFQTLFSTALNKKFSIDAEKTGNPKELSDLYKSLYEKAEKLLNSFQMDSGSAGEQMKDSGRSMQERIDFVQNLNELFSYAQIPVNISGNETNSELFVYMNKGKKLDISKEVSALLHLDMDHLGATDVHVSLSGSVVHTRFYVDDEESANIIDQHMTMLEKAINSAGYSLTNETVTRNQSINSTGNKVVDELLGKDLEQSIKRYSFDVKM
jgi:hypothetical protein